MALALIKPWRTQPYRTVGVNWGNPITRSLLSAISGSNLFEATNGRSVLPIGAANIAQSRYGTALSSTSTTNQGWYSPTAVPPATMSDGVTMLAFITIDSWASFSFFLCVPYGTTWVSPFGACGLQRNITNNVLRVFGTNSSGGTVAAISTINVTAGNTYAIVVARRASSTDFLINGVFETINNTVSSGGLASDPWVNPNKQPLSILNHSSTSPGEGTSGRIAVTAFWTRALSVNEMRSVYNNPWQLFTGPELSVPTYYPILSNLQAVRGNTSANLSTNVNY